MKVNSIADILALRVQDLLDRRLSTIVYNKGLANTPDHARQLIVHKKVIVKNRLINAPSYLVSALEENEIKIKKKQPATPKEETKVEIVESENLVETEEVTNE